MFCHQCGATLDVSAVFCSDCGTKVVIEDVMEPKVTRLQPGYTERIHDPAFTNYLKQSNQWAAIFSGILAVIAFVGFTIAGEMGVDGVENPQGMYIGLGIGGMFILIAFFQIVGKKRSKTWDGVITNKTHQLKREKVNSGDDYYWQEVMIYKIHIKDTSGKKHVLQHRNDATVYNYYQIGDSIRHHAGLNSYEKYDKSRDDIIFCLACGSLHDIHEERCSRCKCPLPK